MSVKTFVNNNKEWEDFKEYMLSYIKAEQVTLEQLTKPEDIYRSQGKIQAFRKLLKFKEEVNSRTH